MQSPNIDTLFETIRGSVKYVELITAIIGSAYYYKYKNSNLKFFLPFLYFLVLLEFFGKYCYELFDSNYVVYNVYHFINFIFVLVLFRSFLKRERNKKWISFFVAIYVIAFFGNMFFENYLTQIQSIPFIIGALLVIITIILYYLEILTTDEVLYVSSNLLFWISIGFLLYFVGKIPTRIVKNYWEGISYYRSIYITEYILAIIMNIFFITGFICSNKVKKY